MKRNCIFFIISFLFLFIFLSKSNFVQAADYSDMGIKTNVEADKSWTIKFNEKLQQSTINNSNISVTDDENGQQVPINISTGNDESSIIVSPKEKYAYGKTYNINISDKLKAQNTTVITKPIIMKFSIKDNPVNTINNNYTVCIDAGHGGDDLGNVGQSGIKEKDVDLSVALKAGKILQESGVNVVYTRNSDNVTWTKDNDLQSRFDIANNNKADFFVSIHSNYVEDNQSANGIETYYLDSDNIGKSLAQSIQDNLINNTGLNDRGIKTGLPEHEILRGTSASSVMVELGFMSNPNENAILGTDNFQNKSASAIASGILKSLSLVDKTKNVTISTVKDLSNTIIQGTDYSLPLTAPATMSDGSSKNVGVIWNSKTVDTSKTGIYTYLGKAAGYSNTIGFTLTIASNSEAVKDSPATINTVKDLSATIIQGSEYRLPSSIPAIMSDGSSKNVSVTWNPENVDTSKIGIYTYLGTVAGYSKPIGLTLTIASNSEAVSNSNPASNPQTSSSNVIVIDPGHGIGSDTGATGINGLQEDDVTLSVGLKVGKILQDHGVSVVYTRTEDMRSTPMSVTESLQHRCDISNNANAKYFVCIHANSFDSPSALGTETLYNTGNPASEKLATAIQNSIVSEVGTYDRGLKDGNWLYVVKNTNASAVLTELGFLTNPGDAEKLSSDSYLQKYAQAIADGILQVLSN